VSFRAFWDSKLTPLWTRFFEQNFRILIIKLYKYTCWASDRNAPFPLGYRNMHDLAGGRLESPSILTKKNFWPGHWGVASWAPLVYASAYLYLVSFLRILALISQNFESSRDHEYIRVLRNFNMHMAIFITNHDQPVFLFWSVFLCFNVGQVLESCTFLSNCNVICFVSFICRPTFSTNK